MLSGSSIKIGRLFGIDIAINLNWFIIFFILVISYSQHFADESFGLTQMGRISAAVLLTLALFGSVLAHEYGHALTARAFGIGTKKIILHLFGGVAFLEREPRKPMHEFWIAIAGPAVSVVLGVGFLILFIFADGTVLQLAQSGDSQAAAEAMATNTNPFATLLLYSGMINLFLGIFNMVPGFPLDGGRVVRAAIWGFTGNYLKATRFAAMGGVAIGSLLVGWGIVSMLTAFSAAAILRILLGFFVIHLARVSTRQAEFLDAFEGLKVRDLMHPVRYAVPAETPLSDVVSQYFSRAAVDQYPVVRGNSLLGSISSDHVNTVPQRQWDWTQAGELARPYQPNAVVDVRADAIRALEILGSQNLRTLPVFDGRRLIGYVHNDDFVRIIRQSRSR